jgi:3-oxoacyl-[acyl-carrier protein] reductase
MTDPEREFDFDFNQRGLQGKTLVLAGGSGGLGSAVAALLARDGASLVLGYRQDRERAARLQTHLGRFGRGVELVQGDIAEAATREACVQAAERIGEEVYGLVCLAGDPARVRFDDADLADLDASMRQNYYGPILLARDFGTRLQRSGTSGAIVLFSTMQAVDLFPSSVNYAAPKAALIHAARILAKQWGGPSGIRVNVIAPGVNRAGMALASIRSGKYDPFVERGIIPRFGRAEDVAKAVRFLVEPDNYITGQVLTVDGGLTLRKDLKS